MEFLKELFGNNALTWKQFSAAATEKKIKIADLTSGKYVDKQKYDDDIAAKDNQIATLNTTIQTRDSDLEKIRGRLSDAGIDESKLSTVLTDLSNLQTKYETDTKRYREQLSKQAYEFAVKEFANGQTFTSSAAKREFINNMIGKELKMDNDKILGADDFLEAYKADNADSFISEAGTEEHKPRFAASTEKQPPDSSITKEQFSKMGYSARNELFIKNRELYDTLTKE